MTNTEGKNYTSIFCNSQVFSARKSGITFYYETKGDYADVPVYWVENVFNLERRAEAESIWQPFAEELFSTILYDEEYQVIAFTIPETIPEGIYNIGMYMEDVRGYTGGEFVPYGLSAYEDEQKQDLWEPGKEYAISLEDVCFSCYDIIVNALYLKEGYTMFYRFCWRIESTNNKNHTCNFRNRIVTMSKAINRQKLVVFVLSISKAMNEVTGKAGVT